MLVTVQVVGALMVLVPFAAQQFGKLNADASGYLWPNAVGSAVLAVLAAINGQWGFLLLEAVWAAVAARSIIRAVRPVLRRAPRLVPQGFRKSRRRRALLVAADVEAPSPGLKRGSGQPGERARSSCRAGKINNPWVGP